MANVTLPISIIPTGGTEAITLEDLAAALVTQTGCEIRNSDGHLILGTLGGTIDLGTLPGWGVPHITILTSGSSWTVPSNWSNSNNKIELIGAGSPGESWGAGGGPGGGYARAENYPLSGGSSVSYQIGISSLSGGDTWFDSSSILMASGGKHSGGSWVAGTGSGTAMTVGYSGGSLGAPMNGGGSAGPNGDGGGSVAGLPQRGLADGGTVPIGTSGTEWGT